MIFDSEIYIVPKISFDYVIDSIMHDEGYRTYPYKDSVGKITIGYGRNIEDNGIDQTEAEIMLHHDIYRAYFIAEGTIPHWHELSDIRKGVFINMAFNLGYRIKSFKKMIKYLRNKDYTNASHEMLDSKWAKQVGSRAERLAKELRYDVRQT